MRQIRLGHHSISISSSAVESLILTIPPLFILLSLTRFLTAAYLFQALAATALVFVLARRHGHGTAWSIRYILLACTLLAYLNGIWNLYDIGNLHMLTDSRFRYIPMSKLPVGSMRFWLTGGTPFVTPLILKIFQRDFAVINRFFIIIYLTGSLLFIWSVTRFSSRGRTRLFTTYLFLLLFLNQSSFGFWMTYCHSETPAMVTTMLFLALFALLIHYRDAFARRSGFTVLALVFLLVAAILFSFSRDTHMYLLVLAIPFLPLAFKRWLPLSMAALMLFSVFMVQKSAMSRSGRWRFSLTNVIMKRVLPNRPLRKYFQKHYALPEDAIVMPCAGKWASSRCRNQEHLFTFDQPEKGWVTRHGMKAYTHFLITHPGYSISSWLTNWHHYFKGIWQYAQPRLKRKLNYFVFYFPGPISIFMAFGILGIALWKFRAQPMILFSLLIALGGGIITFHGDAMEITRHYITSDLALKIAFILAITGIYSHLIPTSSENPGDEKGKDETDQNQDPRTS